jgi:hypothetical protein
MKSNKPLTWIIILFILVGLVVWWHASSEKVTTTLGTTASSTPADLAGVVITSKTIIQSDVAKTYQITATYPVVSGLSNASAQTAVNKTMLAAVQADIADFKSNLGGNPDVPASANDQSTLNITYATTNDPVSGLLTFTIDQNMYSAGSAHPSDQVDAYTFDTSNGDQLYLPDLFHGDYLQTISTYTAQALTTQLGDDADSDQIGQGTAATQDNFKVFVPHADGLHIIFNQYQVASYADGIQEITIPYTVLQNVITTQGKLGSFVQ